MNKRKQQSSRIGKRSMVALLVLAMLISVCVPRLTIIANAVDTAQTKSTTSPEETTEETIVSTETESEETEEETTPSPESEWKYEVSGGDSEGHSCEETKVSEPVQDPEITALYNQVMSYTDAESYWAFLDTMTDEEQDALFEQFTEEQLNTVWEHINMLTYEEQSSYADLPDFSNFTPAISDTDAEGSNTIEEEGRLYVALPADADITGYTPVYTWYKDGNEVELTTTVLGGETNVDQYGEWVNVAVDQGSGATYTVKLTGIKAEDGSVIPLDDNQSQPSVGFPVNFSDEILNGGFEMPDVTENYDAGVQYPNPQGYTHNENQRQFLEDQVSGLEWKTTSACNSIEIISDRNNRKENLLEGQYYASYTALAHGVLIAAEGNQAAELNSQAAGALYQDVLTIPGTTMNWTLEHMGRPVWGGETNINDIQYPSGTDTMYVVIMPTTLAKTAGDDGGEVDTQAEVDQVRNNYGLDAGVQVVQIDYTWYWKNNNTQLFRDEGNGTDTLLYDVNNNGVITQKANPWVETNGQYDVPAGQYMTRYFFVAGPTAVNVSVNGATNTIGNHIDDISFSIDLPKPNIDKANLKLTKTLEGVDELTLEELDALKADLQFDVKIGDNPSYTVYGSSQSDPTATVIKWDANNPKVGTYVLQNYPVTEDVNVTITETIKDQTGSYRLTKVETTNNTSKTSDVTNKESYSVSGQLSGGSICDLKFTNTYAPATTSVTITKKVEGNMGDVNKEFSFDVTVIGGTMVEETVAATGTSVEYTVTPNVVTFSLKNGQSVIIQNVPLGATFTVKENDIGAYEMKIGEKVVKEQSSASTSAISSDFTVVNGMTITVTNTRNVTIDTGVLLDTLPYILILGVVAVGAVLLIQKRRNREDD